MTLTANNIGIRFGGLLALSDVSVSVARGEIVGLVGPNGAGKTTLFNCLSGVARPQQGSVSLGDQDISHLPLSHRIRLGISRTFQTPRLDLEATLVESVMLGFHPRLGQSLLQACMPFSSARSQEVELRAQAERLLQDFQLAELADAPVGELSLGQMRLLEVARALASDPKFLLLDEPAAGIDEQERDLLSAAVQRAAANGLGVLLVEHNVGFVAEMSHRMVALVQGRVVAHGAPSDVVSDPGVVSAYLGVQRVPA